MHQKQESQSSGDNQQCEDDDTNDSEQLIEDEMDAARHQPYMRASKAVSAYLY